MKILIKPFIVASFLLMLSGFVPGQNPALPIMGLLSMFLWWFAGMQVLGAQDRDYNAQLELIRLEHLKAVSLADRAEKKLEELETRVSKALSEVRSEGSRLR